MGGITCAAWTIGIGGAITYRRAQNRARAEYRTALAERYEKLEDKIRNQIEGSVWLPKEMLPVEVPTYEELPSSLSQDRLEWHGYHYGSEYVDLETPDGYLESQPTQHIYTQAHNGLMVKGISNPDGSDFRVINSKVNPAKIMKHVILESPDTRELWYDYGLQEVAGQIASAAMRIMMKTDTQKDRVDLFLGAAKALDLLDEQYRQHEERRCQRQLCEAVLNGDTQYLMRYENTIRALQEQAA
jgi:hypothetical protein